MKCAEPIIDFFWCGSAEQVFGMIHLAVGAYGTTSFGWTFSSFVTFGEAGNTDDLSRTKLPCLLNAFRGLLFFAFWS